MGEMDIELVNETERGPGVRQSHQIDIETLYASHKYILLYVIALLYIC